MRKPNYKIVLLFIASISCFEILPGFCTKNYYESLVSTSAVLQYVLICVIYKIQTNKIILRISRCFFTNQQRGYTKCIITVIMLL